MTDLSAFLAAEPRTILIEIAEAKGSTPRAAGTFMLVGETSLWGTIGGGQFEYMAIDNARAMLAGSGRAQMDIPLGPEIGQCCGGRTLLAFAHVTPALALQLLHRIRREEEAYPGIFLFGAGHVGLALARALSPLPFAVTVVETRASALADLPAETNRILTPMPEAVIAQMTPGGAVVILTHDHALDFLIAEQALARADLGYVGMIGSATKRATFAHFLQRQKGGQKAAECLPRLTMPVGGSAVKDKHPAVIAALVAAELLQTYARRRPDGATLTDCVAG